MEVIIYSTPTCHFCVAAKDYFKANGITYVEHNVKEDAEKKKEMIERTGQMGVPVIQVGKTIIVGFNKGKLDELLKT